MRRELHWLKGGRRRWKGGGRPLNAAQVCTAPGVNQQYAGARGEYAGARGELGGGV